MNRILNHRTASALALAFGLALSAGTAAAGPISNSTNQTLGQVLGNRQTLPVPTDPNVGLQQDRAYRQQLQQQDMLNQNGVRTQRQQSIQDSGSAMQQMRQRDSDSISQELQQLQQQQNDAQELQHFQQLETRHR
jgi:hypothetical protein